MPADLDEVKKRLSMFLGNRDDLVESYLKRYGPIIVMKYVKVIQEDQANPLDTKSTPSSREENKENPLYQIKAICPVCRKDGIDIHELRAKSQIIATDPFMAPIFMGTKMFKTCNYTNIAVTICPHCYFASPDKRDFEIFSLTKKSFLPSQIPLPVISELQDNMGKRFNMVEAYEGTNKINNSIEREDEIAILSYRLADLRAETEARNRIPYSFYKRGSYWTKLALIERFNDIPDEHSLVVALKHFKDAFLRTDFPNLDTEYKTCYIISAILMRLKMEKESREYISVMEKAKTDLSKDSTPESHTALVTVKKWLDKSKYLWECRNDPKTWELQSE